MSNSWLSTGKYEPSREIAAEMMMKPGEAATNRPDKMQKLEHCGENRNCPGC